MRRNSTRENRETPWPPVASTSAGRKENAPNAPQSNPCQTLSGVSGPSGLERVRRAAIRNKGERFSALLHHVTAERLRDAFQNIKRNATPGVDGVRWQHYEADLDRNLEDLHARAMRSIPSETFSPSIYTET